MTDAEKFKAQMDAKYRADQFQQQMDAKYGTQEPTLVQRAARSGIAKFAAPMIGGVVGGPLGTLGGAAAGTAVVPGPGTVAGGIAGGMAGAGVGTAGMEALREQLAGEGLNPTEIRNQGLISAATEPVGLVLGPGLKGVQALRGAGEAAAAGRRFLAGMSGDFARQVETRFPGALAKVEQMGVGRWGVKQVKQALDASTAAHDAAVVAADMSGARTTASQLTQPLDDLIATYQRVGNRQGAKQATQAKAALLRSKNAGDMSPSNVLEIKRYWQKQADSYFARRAAQTGRKLPPPTAAEERAIAISQGAQHWLEDNVAGTAEQNAETRALMGAKQALTSRAARGARRTVAKLATTAATAGLPGGLWPHIGEAALGYRLGGFAEPATTFAAGQGLNALDNPIIQQLILRQLPRATGLTMEQLSQ